jgi:ABC-type microcin C transport system permease subunit YejB
MEKYTAITIISYIINIPMGILVAKSKNLALKLLFIHMPVPILIVLRKTWQLEKYFIAVVILFAILGLLTGKWVHKWRLKGITSRKGETTG